MNHLVERSESFALLPALARAACRPRTSGLLVACAYIASLALVPVSAQADFEHFELDPEHATVAFLIEHAGYARTLGTFTEVSGSFEYDAASGVLRNVLVEVPTASVSTHHEKRDEHVRSGDFLDVESSPTMQFTAAEDTRVTDGSARIEGELTLLGETRPLTLEATVNKAAEYPFGHKLYTLGVSATGSVQRSAYGMDYGVAEALVGDNVELIIEIEANRR